MRTIDLPRQRPATKGTWRPCATPLGIFHVAVQDGHVVASTLPGASPHELSLDDRPRGPLALRRWDLSSGAPVHPRQQAATLLPRATVTDDLLEEAARQLEEWTLGERREFDLPLAPAGTPFQHAVWAALRDIPYGETRSYRHIAEAIGRPGAARAVGQANHRNPLAPFIPCHRVVAADGGLGGYGGGLSLKQAMLEMEQRHR